MRPSILLLALPLAIACGGDSTPPPVAPIVPIVPIVPPAGTAADVFTPGNVFSPFSTTITVGGTVRFNIAGDPHNVIFKRTVTGAPADVGVVHDVVVPRTFATKGTFPYDCTIHPGMSGQVVVQ